MHTLLLRCFEAWQAILGHGTLPTSRERASPCDKSLFVKNDLENVKIVFDFFFIYIHFFYNSLVFIDDLTGNGDDLELRI